MCLSYITMYIDINAISLYTDLNIFQRDECFCLELRLEVEHALVQSKTSLSQIWVICHMLSFVRGGQNRTRTRTRRKFSAGYNIHHI